MGQLGSRFQNLPRYKTGTGCDCNFTMQRCAYTETSFIPHHFAGVNLYATITDAIDHYICRKKGA